MKYDGKFASRWRAKSPDALCAVLPQSIFKAASPCRRKERTFPPCTIPAVPSFSAVPAFPACSMRAAADFSRSAPRRNLCGQHDFSATHCHCRQPRLCGCRFRACRQPDLLPHLQHHAGQSAPAVCIGGGRLPAGDETPCQNFPPASHAAPDCVSFSPALSFPCCSTPAVRR